MYYILPRMIETPHQTNSAVCVSLLEMHTFLQHSALGLLMSKEGLRGEGALAFPTFPFSLPVFG